MSPAEHPTPSPGSTAEDSSPSHAICVSLPPAERSTHVATLLEAAELADRAQADLKHQAIESNGAAGWAQNSASQRAVAAVFTDSDGNATAVVGAGEPVAVAMSADAAPFAALIDLADAQHVFLMVEPAYALQVELALRDTLSSHHRHVALTCGEQRFAD